jgi:DNA-binding response OmpR family regulator
VDLATSTVPIAELQGLRVLVVEDETLVAMLVEEYLADLGCIIVYSGRRISSTLHALKNLEVGAAVLDVNVAGESIAAVAEILEQRKVPFLFASGYGAKGIDDRWAGRPVLQKPFSAKELEAALLACVRGAF